MKVNIPSAVVHAALPLFFKKNNSRREEAKDSRKKEQNITTEIPRPKNNAQLVDAIILSFENSGTENMQQ